MARKWFMVLTAVSVLAHAAPAADIRLAVTANAKASLAGTPADGVLAGGLGARAAWAGEQKSAAGGAAAIDMGGFLPVRHEKFNPAIDDEIGRVFAAGLQRYGFDFVCPSPADLAFGYDYLDDVSDEEMPMLASNLLHAGEAFWRLFEIRELSGVSVCFFSAPAAGPADGADWNGFELADAAGILSSAVPEVRESQNPGLVIALVHERLGGGTDWLSKFAETGVDAVVALSSEPVNRREGNLWLASVPDNGRMAAEILIETGADGTIANVSCGHVLLDEETYANPGADEYLESAFQAMREKFSLAAGGPYPLQNLMEEEDTLSLYSGNSRCLECHEDQYEQWRQTRHASAFDSLFETNRHWIAKCQMCHVTGMGRSDGFLSIVKTPEMAGVNCETCHGPGTGHSDAMGTEYIRPGDSKSMCAQCHDAENSPDFEANFEAYLEKVTH